MAPAGLATRRADTPPSNTAPGHDAAGNARRSVRTDVTLLVPVDPLQGGGVPPGSRRLPRAPRHGHSGRFRGILVDGRDRLTRHVGEMRRERVAHPNLDGDAGLEGGERDAAVERLG